METNQIKQRKSYQETSKAKFENLKTKKDVLILAVESSCDETSVALVENGRKVLSNIISSQIEIHKLFGGVVPEVASRNHIQNIDGVLREALAKAGKTLQDVDAVAVTYGAGLIGALLVGVNFAKTLAYALNVPLIAVSHVHGHIGANYISHLELQPPFVCLMVSGGHTAIVEVTDYCSFHLVGSTVDDSVGECFDKVARVLGLSYPGGPNIDRLAKNGRNVVQFNFKSPLPNTFNFSFSGLKTAVINFVHTKQQKGEEICVEDVACSFQELATDELVQKTMHACEKLNKNKLVVAGGVGANSCLRNKLQKACDKNGIQLFMPKLEFCTDNAAMIGAIAYYYIKAGVGLADLTLTAQATVRLD